MTSLKSKDPSTRTGAVIVRPDRTIASTGFNGFPRGMKDDEELYANREVKYERVLHAERNALLFLNERSDSYSIWTYPFPPCHICALMIIQQGIRHVFYGGHPADDLLARWTDSISEAVAYFREAGIHTQQVEFRSDVLRY